MSNPNMNYFVAQDILHLVITDDEEVESLEISPNITAELNANGELIGVEIMDASVFLRDFILESTQARIMKLKQASYG